MTLVANPSDPSLTFSIRYVDLPGDAVPVRRRGERGHTVVAGAIAGAALAIGLAVGITLGGAGNGAAPVGKLGGPVVGEFRLGPGNQMPPGYVGGDAVGKLGGSPAVGEFRLGPGNQTPPGYSAP